MRVPLRRKFAAIALSSITAIGGVFVASAARADDDPSEASTEQAQQALSPAGKNIVQKLIKAGNFSTLVTAVTEAGLADTLATTSGITVFAPTDSAFAKIPPADLKALIADKAKLKDVLTYHVSPRRLREAKLAQRGSAPTLFGADIAVTGTPEDLVLNGNVAVTLGDIRATNGIIHAIDTVLTPPAKPKDVVDTAIAAGNFSTLVTAVQAAGLEQTLRTTQNITVFAPTNDAFAKIPKPTLDAILADKALLTKILTYHVSGRIITAAQLTNVGLGSIRTLAGERIRFAVNDGKVILNDNVMVTATDIKASNGIIHVIDAVLIPPSVANPPTTTTAAPTTTTTAAPTTTTTTTTAAPTTTTTTPALKDVVDTAIAAGSFKTLVTAVQKAGLEGALRNSKGITVFAPTDEAFAKIPADKLSAILADNQLLNAILKYHVLPAVVTSADLKAAESPQGPTLQGERLKFNLVNGKLVINDTVMIVATDIKASNGIIHVIDAVLIPPSIANPPTTTTAATTTTTAATTTTAKATTTTTAAPTTTTTVAPTPDILDTAKAAGFKTLLAAVDAAGLTQTLRDAKGITVFAPTDAAFAKLGADKINALLADKATLAKILTYHVAPKLLTAAQLAEADGKVATLANENISVRNVFGTLVLNDGTRLEATDIKTSNGIIHVIDTVLIPPSLVPATTTTTTTIPVGTKDVVDTAIAAGSFNTLVAAVQAAGLESALRTTKGITVFAPTDAAFAALGDAKIKALLADPKTLASILSYHVAPSTLTSSQIKEKRFGSVKTLQGSDIIYFVKHDSIIINNQAMITVRDIPASNGIIHVIDAVLTIPFTGSAHRS